MEQLKSASHFVKKKKKKNQLFIFWKGSLMGGRRNILRYGRVNKIINRSIWSPVCKRRKNCLNENKWKRNTLKRLLVTWSGHIVVKSSSRLNFVQRNILDNFGLRIFFKIKSLNIEFSQSFGRNTTSENNFLWFLSKS